MNPTKILMVCLGNICRSPLAQGILESKASKNIAVDSAGTAAYHIGNAPDSRSIAVAKENNIDISNLKARKFTAVDFENFDRIYVMDRSNYKNVKALASSAEHEKKYSSYWGTVKYQTPTTEKLKTLNIVSHYWRKPVIEL